MDDIIDISPKANLLNRIKEYITKNNLDICALFAVNQSFSVKLFEVSNKKDLVYNFSEFINFETNKNCGVYNAFFNKKSIINKGELPFFIKNIKIETYIPITISNDLFACFYLGDYEKETININLEDVKEILMLNLQDIVKLNYQKIAYKTLIDTMILVHEIYSEKIPNMIRHVYNVASWAIQIARHLNYSDDELTKIYLAALMHDIGKIFVESSIINKTGKLTEEEFEEVKKHVNIGYDLAKRMFMFDSESKIPLWIKQHHEKWDGTGYPDGLKWEEITQEGRILKLADSLDAMITERSYKNQMGLKEAIIELKRCRGRDFEPKIVDIAVEILNERISYSNKIFDDLFLPASLIIKGDKINKILEGFISQMGEDRLFTLKVPVDDIEDIDLNNATLVVEKFNIAFEYKIKSKFIDSKNIIINDITPKELEKSFGLLWLLKGTLIFPKTKEAKEITITKISGDDLLFNFDDEYHLEEEGLLIVVVQFEDGTKVPLTGNIIEMVKINKVTHYKFGFTGVSEKYRDEVFRQIFRKQISLKKLLSE